MRDFENEFQDNESRKYAYDFDWRIRESLMNRVRPFVRRDMSVLEVGCFQGAMTEMILAEFDEVDVLEASTELAKKVQVRFGQRVKVYNSTLEEFVPDKTYDLIFLVHTLEHLDDRVSGLTKLALLLSPNGILFVAVPNAYALSRQIAVAMGLVEYEESITPGEALQGHRVTYSLETLTSDCAQSGISALETGGVIVKPLANSQFDQALQNDVITDAYVAACDSLSTKYPELCASIYVIGSNSSQ